MCSTIWAAAVSSARSTTIVRVCTPCSARPRRCLVERGAARDERNVKAGPPRRRTRRRGRPTRPRPPPNRRSGPSDLVRPSSRPDPLGAVVIMPAVAPPRAPMRWPASSPGTAPWGTASWGTASPGESRSVRLRTLPAGLRGSGSSTRNTWVGTLNARDAGPAVRPQLVGVGPMARHQAHDGADLLPVLVGTRGSPRPPRPPGARRARPRPRRSTRSHRRG